MVFAYGFYSILSRIIDKLSKEFRSKMVSLFSSQAIMSDGFKSNESCTETLRKFLVTVLQKIIIYAEILKLNVDSLKKYRDENKGLAYSYYLTFSKLYEALVLKNQNSLCIMDTDQLLNKNVIEKTNEIRGIDNEFLIPNANTINIINQLVDNYSKDIKNIQKASRYIDTVRALFEKLVDAKVYMDILKVRPNEDLNYTEKDYRRTYEEFNKDATHMLGEGHDELIKSLNNFFLTNIDEDIETSENFSEWTENMFKNLISKRSENVSEFNIYWERVRNLRDKINSGNTSEEVKKKSLDVLSEVVKFYEFVDNNYTSMNEILNYAYTAVSTEKKYLKKIIIQTLDYLKKSMIRLK